MTLLAGSTVPFAAPGPARSLAASSSQLTVQVWLAQQEAAAQRYATAVATPGDPLFRHYLSPARYTARFGATASQARAVESWLRGTGFSHVATDPERNYVRATASVAVIDQALNIQVGYYAARLRGYDRAISVPAALDASVLGVTGLDNAAPAMTAAPLMTTAPGNEGTFPCSAWYGQHYASHLPEILGATRFPTQLCGYSAKQLRSAYGYSAKFSGQGQKIALIELGLTPYMYRTLQDYARANDITAPVATRYEEIGIGRENGCGTPFGVEEQTDVEASYMLSPGATHLVVGGDTCDNGDYGLQSLFDADTAVLDGNGGHPLASIVSNSWEGLSENQPAFIGDVEHALLVRAAAEGVGMYFATGDDSGVLTPASDPYAIAVGGTSLGIGAANARVMETGWSTGQFTDAGDSWAFQGGDGAGGGGPSMLWAQPAYQRGVVPPSLARAPGDRGGLVRTIPDVSADADPFTGMAIGMLTLSASGAGGLQPDARRRDQPRHADRRGPSRGCPAGDGAVVRLHRPGPVPAGADPRVPRRVPGNVADRDPVSRAGVQRGRVRRGVAGELRRPELQHARLHRPGDPGRLRHDDGNRHPERSRLHRPAPQARGIAYRHTINICLQVIAGRRRG